MSDKDNNPSSSNVNSNDVNKTTGNVNKKEPPKKITSSYSLLLKGVEESKKKNSTKSSSSSSKKPPEDSSSTMSSPKDESDKNPESNFGSIAGIENPNDPDRSYGDFYCKLCDSHMNSDNMWEAHVTGKRHLKNVEKGDKESKYEELPDVESSVKYELRNVKDPVVGLSYIHELRRKEDNVLPFYSCFLCQASIATVPLLTEHILCMKHRLFYIKAVDPDAYQLIQATNLKKNHMEPLVAEHARKLEQQFGRGTVVVKKEKKKNPVVTYSAKKTFKMNDVNDGFQKSNKNPNLIKLGYNPNLHKAFGQKERSRSPPAVSDTFKYHSSRSPRREFRERERNFSDDDSRDSYKRSFKRDISPRRVEYDRHQPFPKRDSSPKRDYHDDYSHSSRATGSQNRYHYINPRYEQESVTNDYQKSTNAHTRQENNSPPVNRSSVQPHPQKTLDRLLKDSLHLTTAETYRLIECRLRYSANITTIEDILSVANILKEAQNKIKTRIPENILTDFVNQQSQKTELSIPGLGDAIPSAAESQSNRADNTRSALEAYMNMLKSSAKIPPSMFPNLSPASSQQTAQMNTYQMPSAAASRPSIPENSYHVPTPPNFQSSPMNQYQGATANPFSNQGSYQHASAAFASASALNNTSNIPGLSLAESMAAQQQVFNYSHLSSENKLLASKMFPHRY